MSLGLGWIVRDKIFGIDTVDYDSGSYNTGGWVGVAIDVGTGGATAAFKGGGRAAARVAARKAAQEASEAAARVAAQEVAEQAAKEAAEQALRAALGSLDDVPWGRFSPSGCEAAAKRINDVLDGSIKRIKPKRGRFLGPRGEIKTAWPHHDVVVKDGRVYDALTGPDGLAIDEFKDLWRYADEIDFGF